MEAASCRELTDGGAAGELKAVSALLCVGGVWEFGMDQNRANFPPVSSRSRLLTAQWERQHVTPHRREQVVTVRLQIILLEPPLVGWKPFPRFQNLLGYLRSAALLFPARQLFQL